MLRTTAFERAADSGAQARQIRALIDENAMLARELGRVQRRATEWLARSNGRVQHLESELMRTRAQCMLRDTQIAILRESHASSESSGGRTGPAAPSDLANATVLCVGGRARQMPVYRDLVERRGGRFIHAGGRDGDCLDHLGRLLCAADIVIVQAGYTCRSACRAVQAHCAQSSTRCVWLDKPCALAFTRCLEQAPGRAQAPAPASS